MIIIGMLPAGQAWYHLELRLNKTNLESNSDRQDKPGTVKKETTFNHLPMRKQGEREEIA